MKILFVHYNIVYPSCGDVKPHGLYIIKLYWLFTTTVHLVSVKELNCVYVTIPLLCQSYHVLYYRAVYGIMLNAQLL